MQNWPDFLCLLPSPLPLSHPTYIPNHSPAHPLPPACTPHALITHTQVAIKVLNIDYDDPAGLSAETLLRFKAEVDFQRKLSHHP
jgi:hypothetical protein